MLRAWLNPARLQATDHDDVVQNILSVLFRKLPDYDHNGRKGAFRRWLRQIVTHLLQEFHRAAGRQVVGGEELLAELQYPGSELNLRWQQEHDAHLMWGLLDFVRDEFTPTTWDAFRRTALEGEPAPEVALALRLTVNAVHIARSRVLARLRREADDFLESF